MPSYNYKIRGINDINKILNGPIKREPSHNVIFHRDVVVGGTLYVGNISLMKIQPNIVIRGTPADNATLWAVNNETRIGLSDVSATNSPTSLTRCIEISKNTGDSDKSDIVWFEFYDRPMDLSFMDFIGFYYKGKGSQAYTKEDIKIIFFDASERLVKGELYNFHAVEEYNFVESDFTEDATPTWKYSEIPLNSLTRNKRKNIKAIGFYCGDMVNTSTLDLMRIDLYKLGTLHGPVRGIMVSAPIAPNVQVSAGDLVIMDENGYVKPTIGADNNFFGKVVRDNSGLGFENYGYGYGHGHEQYINVIIDGIINHPFDTGTAISSGAGIATTSATKVGKANPSNPQTHMGVAVIAIPSIGGTYPVLIGSRGFVGTL